MFCTNCGRALTSGNLFCSGCGAATSQAAHAPTRPTQNIPSAVSPGGGSKKTAKAVLFSLLAVVIVIGGFFILLLHPFLGANVGDPFSGANAGNIITFGDIDWRVLYTDTANDRKLIITENIIEQRRYHSWAGVTWETSEMRVHLNGEFLNSFNETDRARILETNVINNDNPWFDTAGGNNTQDHIFLLSLDELVRYFGDSGQLSDQNHPSNEWWGFDDQYNENRIARLNNGTASWWWLRSPGDIPVVAATVGDGGFVSVDGGGVLLGGGGVRPALWLNL